MSSVVSDKAKKNVAAQPRINAATQPNIDAATQPRIDVATQTTVSFIRDEFSCNLHQKARQAAFDDLFCEDTELSESDSDDNTDKCRLEISTKLRKSCWK